jgi:hypothetical protein
VIDSPGLAYARELRARSRDREATALSIGDPRIEVGIGLNYRRCRRLAGRRKQLAQCSAITIS